VSTITHPVIQNCPNCDASLPLEALACPQCHALVHSIRLDQLAKDARALEARGLYPQARELWEYSLPLLPHDSKQAEWVRERLRALQAVEAGTQPEISATSPAIGSPASAKRVPPAAQAPPSWIKKLGPFGPLALLLLKLKSVLFFLLKAKFLFSFAFFIVLYVGIFGWRYGLGISVCILIHELGHYIDIKRRGLPAEMPVFLPGFGAYVRWTALGVTRRQIAQISLAGPLAGWIAAAVCFLLYTQTGDPIWAALARTGAFLNTLNLIPVWMLDGGKAFLALGEIERVALLILTLGLWYYTREGLFLFVAAGILWRIFTLFTGREERPQPDWSAWLYYAALLVALAVMLHATPDALANQGMIRR
jgi:Zn-dependent protease